MVIDARDIGAAIDRYDIRQVRWWSLISAIRTALTYTDAGWRHVGEGKRGVAT